MAIGMKFCDTQMMPEDGHAMHESRGILLMSQEYTGDVVLTTVIFIPGIIILTLLFTYVGQ